jgi:hypothetical protein
MLEGVQADSTESVTTEKVTACVTLLPSPSLVSAVVLRCLAVR